MGVTKVRAFWMACVVGLGLLLSAAVWVGEDASLPTPAASSPERPGAVHEAADAAMTLQKQLLALRRAAATGEEAAVEQQAETLADRAHQEQAQVNAPDLARDLAEIASLADDLASEPHAGADPLGDQGLAARAAESEVGDQVPFALPEAPEVVRPTPPWRGGVYDQRLDELERRVRELVNR